MQRNSGLILVAVIAFALAALLVIVDDTPDPRLLWGLGFGGLAFFAAGHLSS